MFTKGKWIVRPTNVGMVIQTDGYGDVGILTIRAEDQENAHLISAAPDMYEALKQLLVPLSEQATIEFMDDFYPGWSTKFVAANQSLAKAEGK